MTPALKRIALAFPSDWSHRRDYVLPSEARGELGPYYIGWDSRAGVFGEDWDGAAHDRQGVLCDAPGYHPIRIAQYALHLHRAILRDDDADARARFFAQASWLRDAQGRRGEVEGVYLFNFPWMKYGAGTGWCSAMAQGEAISVLLRAERLAPGLGFGDAAVKAAQPFKRDIAQGGVVWADGADAFFEEVANEHAAHILNGCIFAFWGLWELHRARQQPWEADLLDRVSRTLVRWLPRYDTGWWSRYSLLRTASGHPHVATLKYHAFHLAQLRVLARMLDEPSFARTADRWEAYIDDRGSRRRVIVATAVSLYDRARAYDTVAGGARADVA